MVKIILLTQYWPKSKIIININELSFWLSWLGVLSFDSRWCKRVNWHLFSKKHPVPALYIPTASALISIVRILTIDIKELECVNLRSNQAGLSSHLCLSAVSNYLNWLKRFPRTRFTTEFIFVFLKHNDPWKSWRQILNTWLNEENYPRSRLTIIEKD